jgi:hypothetical protein
MLSASDTNVNALSQGARIGVSMTSDLFGGSKYLQECVILEESEVCWGGRKNRKCAVFAVV